MSVNIVRILILAALVWVVASGCKGDGRPDPDEGPGYDETVAYLNEHAGVEPDGAGDQIPSTVRLTAEPATPCVFTVVTNSGEKETVQKVDMAELTPALCEVTGGYVWNFVRCPCWGKQPCVEDLSGGTPASYLILEAQDQGQGEHLENALQHLVEMCGGKKEAF